MPQEFPNKPYEQGPDWVTQQAEARRILEEQRQEAEQAKQEEAAEREAAALAQAEAMEARAAEQQLSQRFGKVISLERARAARAKRAPGGRAAAPDNAIAKQIAKLDKEIEGLQKKTTSLWKAPYLFLLVGAAVVDLLQLISDVTLILAIIAVIIGILYSGARYLVIHLECKRIDDNQYRKDMTVRTLVTGAVTMIPWVDMLPEQTMGIIIEWQKRNEVSAKAEEEIKTKRAERDKLTAQAQKAEAQELQDQEIQAQQELQAAA